MSKASSPTVAIRAHGALAGILDIAMRDRRITKNPAREIKLPRKIPKEHLYLSHQQVHDLAKASGDRAPIILLLCYTRLLWAEMVGFRVKDVDFERRRIRVSENSVEVGGVIEVGTPKSHRRRTVPFPHLLDPALGPLVDGKGPDELVFADSRGTYLRRSADGTHRTDDFRRARGSREPFLGFGHYLDVRSDDIDESALLARARMGDPDAFGDLFDLHRDRVFRHALRLTPSVHDAEDVTGLVFLEAWRRRDVMREVDGSVIGWLLVTANNVNRNFSRSRRRYQHVLTVLPLQGNSPDHSDAVDDRLDSDPQRSALRLALPRLSRRDQDVLSLCVIEELSTAEAAAVLQVPPGTVKSRLSRAKARLASLLHETTPLASMEGDLR